MNVIAEAGERGFTLEERVVVAVGWMTGDAAWWCLTDRQRTGLMALARTGPEGEDSRQREKHQRKRPGDDPCEVSSPHRRSPRVNLHLGDSFRCAICCTP